MQDAGAATPWMGPPLIVVPVDGVNVGQVQQRRDGGLFGALAAEEVGGRLGQHDTDGERALVLSQGGNDDGNWITENVRGRMSPILSSDIYLLLMVATDPEALVWRSVSAKRNLLNPRANKKEHEPTLVTSVFCHRCGPQSEPRESCAGYTRSDRRAGC